MEDVTKENNPDKLYEITENKNKETNADQNPNIKKIFDEELSAENLQQIPRFSIKRVPEYISQSDYSFRICVIGDSSVGKTSLLTRYCDNVFKENYNSTIGVDFRVVSLKCKNISAKVHIWDTAGQERFKSISINYFRACHGFMFIYDITSKESFTNVNKWMELAFSNNRMSVANFLVGNKKDLEEKREVSVEEAKELAYLKKLLYLETSAKNNSNVEKAFEYMSYKLIEYYTTNKKDYRFEKEECRLNGLDIKVSEVKKKKSCTC